VFPNLKLIHSMLGGGFFAYVDMLVPPRKEGYSDAVDRFEVQTDRLRRQLKENIFFDVSGAPQWGKAQLECAVKVIGASNILYGSSYPIRQDWYFQGLDFVRSLEISEEDKTAILGGNAIRLFNLW
jgi:predicted TIM-barrel fold metal-dependent hydrolase